MTEIKQRIRILRFALPFLLIPLILILSVLFVPPRFHLLVSFAVAVISLCFFLAAFERSASRSGRLVLAAVFAALSIAGRFIPVFKPVTAMTILAAIYLGSEAGFLVGALSAFLSNFYFGQGPWTPFQMLAWGLIGLIAGFLAKPLRRSKILLLVYGAMSGAAFSLIMDVWTVLWYNRGFDISLYLSAIVSALPFTMIYMASNVVFLLLLSKVTEKKLGRVLIKYRI